MRRYATIAAPDDPQIWSDVSGFWPTKRGTYKTAPMYGAGSAKTATGEGAGARAYGFCAAKQTGTRSYICGAKTWEVSTAFALTDRTGGVAIPQMMAQLGDATIGVSGTATATVVSTGGNFAALAGAPQGNIVVVQGGAVLIFNSNTGNNYWHASDLNDHTNWTTGESANGPLNQTPGPIIGAIAFQDYVLVFKPSAIYRGRYIGGQYKWLWEVVWRSFGMFYDGSSDSLLIKSLAVCDGGVAFFGPKPSATSEAVQFFDGVTCRQLNAEVEFTGYASTAATSFHFDPAEKRLLIGGNGTAPFAYCFASESWGKELLDASSSTPAGFWVTGDPIALAAHYGVGALVLPPAWAAGTNTFTLSVNGTQSVATAPYVQTGLNGSSKEITHFDRLLPLLRSRASTIYGVGNGTSAALTFDLFTERHGASIASNSVTESTQRVWFDLQGVTHAANFARFKVVYNNLTLEIDDVDIGGLPGGRK